MKLNIDPQFTALIPQPKRQEVDQLERNLLRDGCRDPITVWRNGSAAPTILDGHHRYEICTRHGLPFEVKEIAVRDQDGARLWILSNQRGRRNISDDQRAVLAELEAEIEAKISRRVRARRAAEVRERKDVLEAGTATKIPALEKVRVRSRVAKRYGVSERKVRQVRLIRKAAPDLHAHVVAGKMSLAKAVRKVRAAVAEKELREWERSQTNKQKFHDSAPAEILLADPPWQYDLKIESHKKAVDSHYPTATLEQICSHRNAKWFPRLADDCVLFMWATAPKLREALHVVEAWGFVYRTHAVWFKHRPCTGYWFRNRHELLLVATKGNPVPPIPSRRFESVFNERQRAHSIKPQSAFLIIEQMFPKATRCELYSRRPHPGWRCVGPEAATTAIRLQRILRLASRAPVGPLPVRYGS